MKLASDPRDLRGIQVGCIKDPTRGMVPIYLRKQTPADLSSPSPHSSPHTLRKSESSNKTNAGTRLSGRSISPPSTPPSSPKQRPGSMSVAPQPLPASSPSSGQNPDAVIYQVSRTDANNSSSANLTSAPSSSSGVSSSTTTTSSSSSSTSTSSSTSSGQVSPTPTNASSPGTPRGSTSSDNVSLGFDDSTDAEDVEFEDDTDTDLRGQPSHMGHHHHHKSRSSKQKQSFVDKLMSCLGMKRRGAQTKKRKQSFDEKNSLAQDVDPSSKDQLVSSPTTTTNLAASDSSKSSTTNMDEGTELTPVDGHGARLCPDGQGGWYYLVPHAALLPPQFEPERGRKTLILDLDETLVHSSFKPVPNADFIVPVRIDTHVHQAYVLKRPGVDAFMKRCGELFEVVVFTASLASYANPVLDLLDRHQVVRTRLFREACVFYRGGYVKDVSRMGRSMEHTTIIDNFAASYCLTPQNGIPILSWFDDPEDRELAHMVPLLEKLAAAPSIYNVLDARGMKAVYSN